MTTMVRPPAWRAPRWEQDCRCRERRREMMVKPLSARRACPRRWACSRDRRKVHWQCADHADGDGILREDLAADEDENRGIGDGF